MNGAENDVICRPIKVEELEMIMNWRMREDITKYMYTDPHLTLDGQLKWYEKISNDPNSKYMMIEVDRIPCGVLSIVDIDRVNKRCSWGIYLGNKEKRSLELMIRIEMTVYEYAFSVLGMNKVCGEVMTLNKGVIRIHKMCGCEVEGELKQHILKNGKYYDVTLLRTMRDEWNQFTDKINLSYVTIL